MAAIGDFIHRESPARAATFVALRKTHCRGLGKNFFRYPPFPISETDSIQRAIFRNYIIFYRVMPDRVSVLRIVHGAQDLDLIFDP